jgi:hypothetical protein
MPRPFAATTIGLVAVLTFSSILCAQTSAPTQLRKAPVEKWNNDPFNGNGRNNPAIYITGKPAPRRDLSGIWDATAEGGVQASGAAEHPASYPPGDPRPRAGQPDEKGIINPIPYTPFGETALKANKPSGTSIRSVPAVLSNDPVDSCEPVGYPFVETFEFLTIELAQTKNQVIYLGQYQHEWRTIWTDGRELPKDPRPRWNGYSVGHWVDDYTFVSETVGMNEKSWVDHAGRPHSKDLRVTEIFHLVDYDTMEHTLIINDTKMYTEPWLAHNKLILHRQPADFDIREMFCSPSETATYNKLVGEHIKNAPAVGKKGNPDP